MENFDIRTTYYKSFTYYCLELNQITIKDFNVINILIADNQVLTREGLNALLANEKGINVSGRPNTSAELMYSIGVHRPEVIIMDYNFDHFFSINDIKSIYEQFDFARILVLSNKQHKNEILEVIGLGVKNYVGKDCSPQEMINAVFATAKGEQFYCENTFRTIFGEELPFNKIPEIPPLSFRETEIVHLIADGLANKEIAEKLFLSIHTVKTHRKNIIKKLGFTFKNATELILLISYLNDVLI